MYPLTPSNGCGHLRPRAAPSFVTRRRSSARELRALFRGDEFAPPRELQMRIPERILDCTVYLYPDEASARCGDMERLGGSGFVVARPASRLGKEFFSTWLVTNRHVIEKGAWTVRINTIDGKFDTIDTNEPDWFFHPDGDDLAVCPIETQHDFHKFVALPVDDFFMSEETLKLYAIGPGDQAFTVGRFVSHEGRLRNTPTSRFGQIAQMPIEKIVCDGRAQESFLVEIRSLGGYSGSPVFVWLDPIFRRPIDNGLPIRRDARGQSVTPWKFDSGPWLLGVDWCMLPSWEPVCDKGGEALRDGWMVPANTGMMGVIPSWRLYWLLMKFDRVVNWCEASETEILKMQKKRPPSAIPTSAVERGKTSDGDEALPSSDENPIHREDFTRLLGAAARKPEQEG